MNWPLLLAILTGPFGLAVWAIIRYKDQIIGTAARWAGILGRQIASDVSKPFRNCWLTPIRDVNQALEALGNL